MIPSKPKFPWLLTSSLTFIAVTAAILAFQRVDHGMADPNSGIIIAIHMGVFFVSFSWALFRVLRWRDLRRAAAVPAPTAETYRPELAGTIYGMIPGRKYQVIQSFTDFYGNTFEQNERMQFKQRHFLPYHGGHTIVFNERSLYLQEDTNKDILDRFSEYILLVE